MSCGAKRVPRERKWLPAWQSGGRLRSAHFRCSSYFLWDSLQSHRQLLDTRADKQRHMADLLAIGTDLRKLVGAYRYRVLLFLTSRDKVQGVRMRTH